MKLVTQIIPASANSFATSPTLLMFSSLSPGLKPRFLLRPVRRLSPSRPYVGIPRKQRYCSSALAIVVLPAPDRPVWEKEFRDELVGFYDGHTKRGARKAINECGLKLTIKSNQNSLCISKHSTTR